MNKFRTPLMIATVLVIAGLLTACNNPHAAKTNAWTGDRTWAQTWADAEQACKELGMGLVSVSPDNGEPSCGGTYEATVSESPAYVGEAPTWPGDLGTGPSAVNRASEGCPTVEEANQAVFGGMPYFVRVSSEACAFQINTTNPDASVQGVVPTGVIATVHQPNDDPRVFVGKGQKLTFWRATFRWTKGYPASDVINAANGPCQILSKEDANGMSQDPAFHVLAGNIACK